MTKVETPAAAVRTPIVLLGLLTAMGPAATDMYLPALPQIAEEFHTGIGAAERTMAVFFVGMGLGQLFYGPLSDRVGRRVPLLCGMGLYLAATVGCALSTSIEMLTAMRLVQALGGCAGVVIARAVVRDRFGPQESMRVYSLLMLVMGISPILAPLLGGYVLLLGGWRATFWALFAMGAVLAVWAVTMLSESRPREAAKLARTENPLRSYLVLLRDRHVMGFVLTGAFAAAAMPVYVASSPELVINTYGVSPQAFGWVFGANAVGLIGGSQINAWLSRRFPPVRVLKAANRVSLVVAGVLLVNALTGFGGMWGVMIPLFLLISSLGFNQPNALAGGMARDSLRAGSISALMGAFHFSLGGLNIALASTLKGAAASMAIVMAGTIAVAVTIFLVTRPEQD